MKHLGLFEGIGGFSLAARWIGWETLAWCEWLPFNQKILKHHFPGAEGFGDITKTNFTKYANRIDILTGGFPCQPYSVAGKRKGKEDERHLWPEMLRAIREVKPTYVVGENVLGLVNWNGGLVFHEVQADLETEGYEVQPFLLPACGVNAPHRRDRIWFVAYSGSNGHERRGLAKDRCEEDKGEKEQREWERVWCNTERVSEQGTTIDPNLRSDRNIRESDREKDGLQELGGQEIHSGLFRGTSIGNDADPYNNINGGIGFSPNWKSFPTQSPLCGRNDGVPNRVDRIKALGNAIVPQIALEIFKAINTFELSKCL